ncbi:MAG: hypothetical protein FJ290_11880 [Planctomycetes bacterium]|nr:hypothetical protein [Planctomycetota bacterium]
MAQASCLRCWNAADGGKAVWALNLYDKYKAPQRPNVGGGRRDYGYPTSPLVRGGLVIIEVGAPGGTVMAFDKRTGERRWASEFTGPAGHTGTPVELKIGDVPCLAILTLQHVVVMRLDGGHEGKTVATAPWHTEFACNVSTPAVAGNRVLITSEYNHSVSTRHLLPPRDAGRWRAVLQGPGWEPGVFFGAGGGFDGGPLATRRPAVSRGAGAGGRTRHYDMRVGIAPGDIVLVEKKPVSTARAGTSGNETMSETAERHYLPGVGLVRETVITARGGRLHTRVELVLNRASIPDTPATGLSAAPGAASPPPAAARINVLCG